MSSYTKPPDFEPELLDEYFTYNEENGNLYRKQTRGGKRAGTLAGYIRSDGYTYVRVNGRQYLGHLLVWYMINRTWPTHQLDHINGNKADNRIQNLRDVPQSLNQLNKSKANPASTSGLIGAHKNNGITNPWKSRITMPDGTRKSLGTFKTAEEASAAYLAARAEIYGI